MNGLAIHRFDSDRSSVVQALGYDGKDGNLLIQFRSSGAVWRYARVSADTYRDLLAAESMGAYVASVIKKERNGEKVEMMDWLRFVELCQELSAEERKKAYESANKSLFEQLRKSPLALGF